MTPRTWTEPATVVIPTELMADFEEWLDQRRLLLLGPARMSSDPDDLVWTVGPRREDLLARRGDTGYDRSANLRAKGISEEEERAIRQRAAEANRIAKEQEEQDRLARQRSEDYQGD